MKTKYFIYAIIFCGGYLTNILLDSQTTLTCGMPDPGQEDCTPVSCLNNTYNPILRGAPVPRSERPSGLSKNAVHLNEALRKIQLYRLWLKYIPNYFQFEDSEDNSPNDIRYLKRSIDERDRTLVSELQESLVKCTSSCSNQVYLFGGERTHAVYIDSDDIEYARKDLNELDATKDYSGIRVYMAATNHLDDNASRMRTHVYIVPTFDETFTENQDSLNNEDFVYVESGYRYQEGTDTTNLTDSRIALHLLNGDSLFVERGQLIRKNILRNIEKKTIYVSNDTIYLRYIIHRDFVPYIGSEENREYYVYDLTTPCPAACDNNSRLQNLRIE